MYVLILQLNNVMLKICLKYQSIYQRLDKHLIVWKFTCTKKIENKCDGLLYYIQTLTKGVFIIVIPFS